MSRPAEVLHATTGLAIEGHRSRARWGVAGSLRGLHAGHERAGDPGRDLRGNPAILSTPYDDLSVIGWNDRISSFQGLAGAGGKFFEHIYGSGRAYPFSACTSEAVSGTVANNAAWAYYDTDRTTTDNYYGPRLQVLSWSGTGQYYYLRNCVTGNPIGSGTPNSPIKAAVSDTTWKQLGPLPSGTCFNMTAKKDWSWPTGYSWWTGNLQY